MKIIIISRAFDDNKKFQERINKFIEDKKIINIKVIDYSNVLIMYEEI